MTARGAGLGMFWIGAVVMVAVSWLAMWWLAPIWRATPPQQFEGTVWAFEGPVFMLVALSVPLGILLVATGMVLHARSAGQRHWPIVVFALAMALASSSMLFPATLGYHPVWFGMAGGLIYLFFFAAIWFWGKSRRRLTGLAAVAAGCQLASYVFFLLIASLACTLLGNPYSGLYFPERVIAGEALPYHYAMGTKMALYFVLGWLLAFLAQWLNERERQGRGHAQRLREPVAGGHAS